MTILAVVTNYSNLATSVPTFSALSPGYFPSFSSTAAARDSNYASTAIATLRNETDIVIDLGAGYTDIWIHCEVYLNAASGKDNNSFIGTTDASGNLQLALLQNGTGGAVDAAKSTNGTSYGVALTGPAHTFPAKTRQRLDVHFKIAASGGEVAIYINEVLAGSVFTGDTSTNGSQNMRYLFLRSPSSVQKRQFTQIIVADTDTRGFRVQDIGVATGTQDFSQWTGDFDQVNSTIYDKNDFTSAFDNTVGDRVSYVTGDCTSAASALVVRAVVASAKAFVTPGATPTGIALGLSIGSTLYEGTTKTLSLADGVTNVQHIWHSNPSNGSGWTQADINALQLGARAK